jgi:hypothetical protein
MVTINSNLLKKIKRGCSKSKKGQPLFYGFYFLVKQKKIIVSGCKTVHFCKS